jgi:hypothetical protein
MEAEARRLEKFCQELEEMEKKEFEANMARCISIGTVLSLDSMIQFLDCCDLAGPKLWPTQCLMTSH